MATFGKTDVGGSQYTYFGYGGRDEQFACKFTLSEDASLESVSLYFRHYNAGPVANSVKLGVYSDSSGPDALLGTTEAGAIPAYGSPAWVTLDFASPVALSAGDYWLAAIINDNRCVLYYDSGASGQTEGVYNGVDFTAFLNPFGGADWTEAWAVSIYATYAALGGVSVPVMMNHYGTHINKKIKGG